MDNQKYQLSSFVKIISDPDYDDSFMYHSLFGNARIVNSEALNFLNLFREPISIKEVSDFCSGNPKNLIKTFTKFFFLVKPDFDEIKFLDSKKALLLNKLHKKQMLDRIGLAISDSCNLSCKHCIHFQRSSGSNNILPIYQKRKNQLMMTFSTAINCIEHFIAILREQNKDLAKIHIGNAEPLMNWSVIDKILDYSDKIDDIKFEFAINTNLILLTEQIALKLKKYNVRISTSLDGNQVANDLIRVTKNGLGTYSKIIEKFNLLDKIGYSLDGFSITVTRDNFDQINTDIIDFVIERNMNSIAFDYDLINLIGFSVEERVEKIITLKKYANRHGIYFFGTWDTPFRNLVSFDFCPEGLAFCSALQGKSLEFNVDGSIKICSHTTTTIGHYNNFDNIFAINGQLSKLVSDRFPGKNLGCKGCELEGVCGGQCQVTKEVFLSSKNDERKNLFSDFCNFYRAITKALAIEYIHSNNLGVKKILR